MGKRLTSKATGISSVVKTASGKASAIRGVDPQEDEITIAGDTASVKKKVKEFVEASTSEKSYKEKKEQSALFLRKYITDLRNENASHGDYQKTYRVLGPKTSTGTQYAADLAHNDKFSLPSDSKLIEGLKEVLPKDVFDETFEKELTIQIKPEILKNDKLRREFTKEIVDAIGVDGLRKYFTKDEVYVVKGGLDKRQFEMDDEVREELFKVLTPSADTLKDSTYKED